jgi:CRP/FNR family transcriptional regulator
MLNIASGMQLPVENTSSQFSLGYPPPSNPVAANAFAQAISVAPSTCLTNAAAGRQLQGPLWTDLPSLCAMLHVPVPAMMQESNLSFQHIRFSKRQRIFTQGQPFSTLYLVHSGFLKTLQIDEYGNEQALGFPMKGDLFGVDGIYQRRHISEAVALTDCNVILLPFAQMRALGRTHPDMDSLLYALISRELIREQCMVGMLGLLRAECRVARFLISLSERYAAMGYSGTSFILRMTRQEIGSYLGLTLETVSRTLSGLYNCGYITVDRATIGIRDMDALRTLRRLPPASIKRRQRDVVCNRSGEFFDLALGAVRA